ncbi:MAG: histidine phosphatase family protein, partial [Litoreibacter sp.]|nr:histidine phosphatase family protein [Litoreibacter sp.]
MLSENPSRVLMSEGAGKTIVWVGNKGNLANIWESLGAPGPAPLEYGDVFIVEPAPSGPPSVIRRSYEP